MNRIKWIISYLSLYYILIIIGHPIVTGNMFLYIPYFIASACISIFISIKLIKE